MITKIAVDSVEHNIVQSPISTTIRDLPPKFNQNLKNQSPGPTLESGLSWTLKQDISK